MAEQKDRSEYFKEYQNKNREKINDYRRGWRKQKSEDPKWAKIQLDTARERSKQWYKDNKEKAKEINARWRAANPDRVREIARKSMAKRYPGSRKGELLRQRYGLTIEKYRELVDASEGKCQVCSRPFGTKGPCVDHCHETKAVRGILCFSCNSAEGLLKTPEIAFKMYEYMKRHEILTQGVN